MCGHRNPNPTPYTSICKKCNRPLENSFKNWCKNSSTDSFDDYLKVCCEKNQLMIESQVNNTPQQTIIKEHVTPKYLNSKKRKDPFLALVLSIFLGPLGVCYSSMIAGLILFLIPTFILLKHLWPILQEEDAGGSLILFSWFDNLFLGGLFNILFSALVSSIYMPFWIIGIPLSVIIAYVRNKDQE